jgi:1-acyl-sn-glycerol-3-phosphate acyltransferase
MNCTVRHLRATFRAFALGMVTVFLYGLWLSLSAFLLPFRKSSDRWRSFNFRNWAEAAAALLGMRILVEGTRPRPPFILVSNHLSYLDVVTLASQLDCLFIAKSDVADWPFLGLLCRSMGTIFVNRDSRKDILRVNHLIQRALADGKGVLLFPEATSTAGLEVLPFHSALLEPAARAGYPVSYAAITYHTPAGESPASLSVCWWGDMTFLSHLYRVFQLTSFDAKVTFGAHSIRADDRKVLAKELWQAVQREFVPSAKTEELCKLVAH